MRVSYLSSLFITLISLTLACSKKDEPTNTHTTSEPEPLEATHTIMELINDFSDGEIKEKVVVKGSVISSDKGGNIQNHLFIRDYSGALRIAMTGDKLYQTYPQETELLVVCTGLKVDRTSRTLTMADGNPLTSIDSSEVIIKTGENNRLPDDALDPNQLSDDDLNSNFVASGFYFDESLIGEPFIDAHQTTIRSMKHQNGKEIKVIMEPGSSFDDENIPEKFGPVKGLLVKMNGDFVLRPRGLDDMIFTANRIPPFEKRTFTYNGNTLPYQVLFPRNYDPTSSYPLVIFLHGAGERGSNNTSQMAYGSNTFGSYDARTNYPAIVIFPQCPSNTMWSRRAKYDQNGQLLFEFPVEQNPNTAMEMVIELVRDYVAHEAVDDKRIYVSGLSMGGIGTFEFCYYAPDLPAAAVSIAGGHDSAFVDSYAAGIDFRLYHGDNDGVVPPRYSREMHTALQQGGFSSEYFEAPGRGHEWNYVLNDPDYIQWMFNQSR
ncbi:MAG TPA: hypothetical protein DCG19_09405 [Cryomorphaceae bacterium]|nr:hypothetical protein [Owenweeksia sp.]MBF99127.1 hypothetical protein [Owenweeksia sp.]HAD97611.1 hypothetical protein [Cryomorphaceae bacterium]HCQ16776.1 hypothetical protein [Cryomorphaceae bacterium]|tara:strand:+ start:738 stop:2207 length:1470 start_codon:yes stop_codon:yes gene_type:complete